MNQGKLEMVKQEMARVNTDILEISELKWTRMSEFNSDDHFIYILLWTRIPLKKWTRLIVSKSVKNAVLVSTLKNDRMISVRFQSKPFNITVSQVYAPTN